MPLLKHSEEYYEAKLRELAPNWEQRLVDDGVLDDICQGIAKAHGVPIYCQNYHARWMRAKRAKLRAAAN